MSTMHANTRIDDLEFILSLRRKGIQFSLEGQDLICEGPDAVITNLVAQELKKRKQNIVRHLEAESESLSTMLPSVSFAPQDRYEPFSLTENQQAYWIGRGSSMAFGRVGIHVFFELQLASFDAARFAKSWNTLLNRHDMLHAVVLPDGTQQVLKDFPAFTIEHADLSAKAPEVAEAVLEEQRALLSHYCYDLEKWPQHTFRAFKTGAGEHVLFGSIDYWCLDGRSLQIMMHELATLYLGTGELSAPPALLFRDYVNTLEGFAKSKTYGRSLNYWRSKVATLPGPPTLPLKTGSSLNDNDNANQNTEKNSYFKRFSAVVSPEEYKKLRGRLRQYDLTLSSALLACYAETLGHWAEEDDFTINVPRINRLLIHPDVDSCVGEFASFALTRVNNSDKQRKFFQKAKAIQEQIWQDLQHGAVSGMVVLREWKQAMHTGPEAGMPYVFTSAPEGNETKEPSWMQSLKRMGTVRQALSQTPQVWIDSQYEILDDSLYLSWDVREDLFPKNFPQTVFDAYVRLIKALANADSVWEEVSPFYESVALSCQYSRLAGPAVPLPALDPMLVMQKRVAKMGESIAVYDAAGSITWRENYEKTEALINFLKKSGLSQGQRVALLLSKGRWQGIASLAVYAAGGVSVPIDTDNPVARIKELVAICDPALVLSDDTSHNITGEISGVPSINLEQEPHRDITLSKQEGDEAVPHDLFSIIYTSGSTGVPKGVMLTHGGICNVAHCMEGEFSVGAATPVLSLSPFHHDMAITDFIGHVFLGMPIIYPSPERKKDPQHWLELLQTHNIAFWNTVPAMMTMLLDYYEQVIAEKHNVSFDRVLHSLKFVLLGGDWIPLSTASRIFAHAPHTRFFSIGGPTETTLWNIFYETQAVDASWSSIPYGKPIQNTVYHVLDPKGRPVPRGVTGELGCSGPYMSAGYLNDPGKTAAAFTALPVTGERLYRTGDLGKMRDDGVIEFIGRKDRQTKIGGYRIEPAEIEAALQKNDSVSQAIVLVFETPGGSKKLCAWVCLKPGLVVSDEDLRGYLEQTLPSYMIPTAIKICPAFPLTANGKIDRTAVAAWPIISQETRFIPATPTEQRVAEAWKEVLGFEPSSRNANFFESGGDSIMAIRLLNKLRDKNRPNAGVLAVFQYPVLRQLSEYIDRLGSEAEKASIPALTVKKDRTPQDGETFIAAPATQAQIRFWFDEQISSTPGIYNLPFRMAIEGDIEPKTLEAALNKVVARHDTLRTTLHTATSVAGTRQEAELWQHVHTDFSLQLEVIDLTATTPEALQKEKRAIFNNFISRPFVLSEEILLRTCLIREPKADTEQNSVAAQAELYLVFHHTIFDGWSMKVFMEDLEKALNGEDLRAAPASMIDVAEWERSPEMAAFIDDKLHSLTSIFNTVYPLMISMRGMGDFDPDSGDNPSPHGFLEFAVNKDIAALVQTAAAKQGVTAFVYLYSIFAVFVSRYSDTQQMTLGTYSAQRYLPELEDIIGPLVNPVPMQVDLSKAGTFSEALRICEKSFLGAMENEVVPFNKVVEAVAPERMPDQHPLFTVAFSQDALVDLSFKAGGINVRLMGGGYHKTNHDLGISIHGSDDNIVLYAVYQKPNMSGVGVQAILERYVKLMERVAKTPDLPLHTLSLCTDNDINLLEEWNSSPGIEKPWVSLWQPFTEIADAHPDRRLISWEKNGKLAALNAKQLNILAAAIGRKLLSTVPGDALHNKRVVLHMPRGPELIAAMLATLKYGGTFILAGMSLPDGRLDEIVEQSKADVLIVASATDNMPDFHTVNNLTVPVINVFGLAAADRDEPNAAAAAEVAVEISDDTVACIVFTSGSTGKMKGVIISYGSLINRIQWGAREIPFAQGDVCCAKTDINFVDAITEIMTPVLHGINLHIIDDGDTKHMDSLFNALHDNKISRIVAVPSALREIMAIARAKGILLPHLRQIITSGEAIPVRLALELRETFKQVTLYNLYGSSEITGDATSFAIEPMDADRTPNQTSKTSMLPDVIPIGRPISKTKVHVMDAQRNILPHGMVGEICVTGTALCQGYLENTDGAPVRQGFFTHQSQLYFATGDLGMWHHDGQLLYLGRNDRQLKIRGHRVAPQEVEAWLLRLPGVHDAAVVGADSQTGTRVFAFVIDSPVGNSNPAHVTQPVTLELVRDSLGKVLLPAFIPSGLMHLEAFPKTISGKTDYRALERIALEELEHAAAAPVQNEVVDSSSVAGRLKTIYSELLHTPVDLQSNFFDAGGHSLLAVQLVLRLQKEFNIQIQARSIFEYPVISDLAAYIERQCEKELTAVAAAAQAGGSVPAQDKAAHGGWEEI